METLTPEELLFISVMAISGIHPIEASHEPKKITDTRSVQALYEIARRYQVYSYDIVGDSYSPLQETITIVRLCDHYFSVEKIWSTGAIKIRWMEELDFKSMIENEKKIFDKMDTEE